MRGGAKTSLIVMFLVTDFILTGLSPASLLILRSSLQIFNVGSVNYFLEVVIGAVNVRVVYTALKNVKTWTGTSIR